MERIMQNLKIPYSDTYLEADIPDENFIGVFVAEKEPEGKKLTESELVRQALANPISSPRLADLAKNKKNMVIITSDHTRPVPSKITLPVILEEARRNNPDIEITILIATGYHRATTDQELLDKFGAQIVENENIVIHDSRDSFSLVRLNDLPSGGELWVNKLAIETELLIAEGFIEPHFFAGFSGGRKSVLPGVAGAQTVLANHCSKFINSESARAGSLEDNPIHRDMLFAAGEAKLAFILNVVLDEEKKIEKAFAGHFEKAHLTGCRFLESASVVEVPSSDIVITSNGGYPLDQNIYQAVKGMSGAESAVKKDGVIIMVSACDDGHGGESFYENIANMESPAALLEELAGVPATETAPDQWEFQILARILNHCTVIMVTDKCDPQMIKAMHMEHAYSMEEALKRAFELKGNNAGVSVITDGVSVIVRQKNSGQK
jgi:nickel-dependent lactate racemase